MENCPDVRRFTCPGGWTQRTREVNTRLPVVPVQDHRATSTLLGSLHPGLHRRCSLHYLRSVLDRFGGPGPGQRLGVNLLEGMIAYAAAKRGWLPMPQRSSGIEDTVHQLRTWSVAVPS